MSEKIVYVRTRRGEDEVGSRTAHLSKDIKRALLMVDGSATVAIIMKRSSPSLRGMLLDMFFELAREGYIQDKAKVTHAFTLVTPRPLPTEKLSDRIEELDFTAAYRVPTAAALSGEANKFKLAEEAKLRAEAERHASAAAAARKAAKQVEEERARLKSEVAKFKAHAKAEEKARAETEKKDKLEAVAAARIEAEQQIKTVLEVERKAKQAAEQARQHEEAERHAREILTQMRKIEQQAAQAQADKKRAEEKRKLEDEVARLKAQAEEEARARNKTEALLKQQAQTAHLKAEQEARRIREEVERAKQQVVDEARVREADRISSQVEIARVQAEREAEKKKLQADQQAQLDAVKAQLETEARARLDTDVLVKQQAEAACIKADQEVARIREEVEQAKRRVADEAHAREAERIALKAEYETAKKKLEAEQKLQFEAVTAQIEAERVKAEQEASRVRDEVEQAKLRVTGEVRAREKAEKIAREAETARVHAEQEATRVKRVAEQAQRDALETQAEDFRMQIEDARGGNVVQVANMADKLPAALESKPDEAVFNFAEFDVDTSHRAEQDVPQHQIEPSLLINDAENLLLDAAKFSEDASVSAEPVKSEPVTSEPVTQQERAEVETQSDIYSEADARQLADEQAEKWAKAERRSIELANRKEVIVEAPVVAVSKPRRKPVPWGKLGALLFVLSLIVLAVMPAILPMQTYVKNIEQLMTSRLHQPVHIGHLAARILPTPRLVLSEVSVGDQKQIQLARAQVDFSFSALWGAVKSINRLELDDVQLRGDAFSQVSAWVTRLASTPLYPVARIVMPKARLGFAGVAWSDVGGELDFTPEGQFTSARLHANRHKLAVEIHATPEKKLALSLTLRDSALPLLPNWVFDEFTATGELTRDELRITDVNSRIRGGVLTGYARINWRDNWRAEGVLKVKVIPLKKINKLLVGNMDGTAHFKMQSDSLRKLTDTARLKGNFFVKKGMINGVDIIESTRLRSRARLPGGRTYFDEMSGELSYANDRYHIQQLKISDSVLSAEGELTVVDKKLSGLISARLVMRSGSTSLKMGGSTESPSIRVGY
ncbi:MAG: hypothetical protein R8K48_04000 [Gallionella sp.]